MGIGDMDGSKFEIFGNHRRQYCRTMDNEELNPKRIAPNMQYSDGSIMF